MSKDTKYYLIAFALFIVGGVLGFFIAKNMASSSIPLETESVANNDIYTVQSAIIRGVVNSVTESSINVTNQTNNTTSDIPVSARVVIANPSGPSSDPATIQTGKPVVISLEMIDGQYQAVSIQYVTPAPSVPNVIPSFESSANPTE